MLPNNALDYLAEYKYNPDSGLVLEYYRIWNSEERPGEYELRTRDFANAKYGDGAGDLQLVALPPLETRVTVDTARLKSEAEARFKEAAEGPLQGILGYSEEPLVSSDYKGDPRSSIVDALSTRVIGGTFIKVVAWYDNEWGYSCRTADLAALMAKSL